MLVSLLQNFVKTFLERGEGEYLPTRTRIYTALCYLLLLSRRFSQVLKITQDFANVNLHLYHFEFVKIYILGFAMKFISNANVTYLF